MTDKIYQIDNLENQQIFHDIEQSKKYSNYSIELNQTFGDKSYEKFYKSLMEHKKARGMNFMSMFQKPKNVTGLKTYEEPFNISEFKMALKKMEKKNDKMKYRIKNPYKIRPKFKSVKNKENINENNKIQKTKKKIEEKKKDKYNIVLPDVPEVGRYHPSYDVLDKHIYNVAFSQQNFYDFNKSGKRNNHRNIFTDYTKTDYNYNDKPLTLEMKKKLKKRGQIKPISIETLNNMSKTYNRNAKNQTDDLNKSIKSISNHYNTSSLFSSINLEKNPQRNSMSQNISTNMEINKSINSTTNNINNLKNASSQINDSQILIRTNGDKHSRCPKHLSVVYNTNSPLLPEEILNNTYFFNKSKDDFNPRTKDNHCLKFEIYSKRKPMIYKFNYIYEDFMNTDVYKSIYQDKDKICLEFNKLSTGKDKQKCFFELEASKNKNPPLGIYHPKFNQAFKKVIDVYIDKKKPSITNKRRLKEIVLKYDVPSNYLLFDILNKKK